MASIESTSKLSGVLASLTETLANFRTESAEIESEFFELVEGIAELGPMAVDAGVISKESPALDSIAVGHLKKLDQSIAKQRVELSGKQNQLSEDVGQLREIVDRQAQLFAAWINATSTKSNPSGNVSRKDSSEDEVLSDVCAQFEELGGATVDPRM